MQLSLIDIFLSDGAAKAVCWTLVHSLWEGILAAVVAGLIIACTRKLPATLRYNLLTADLLLFLLVAGATFCYEFRQSPDQSPVQSITVATTAATTVAQTFTPSTPTTPILIQSRNSITSSMLENLMQKTGDYLNTHAILVTLVWLACLSVQMLRLIGGLYQVRRLRRNSIVPAGESWNERLLVLARRLEIKRAVTLLQSGLVQSPATLGFLKPAILVPLGMFANLPPDQVETILLHELAHIRRGDFAANLVLHFTEAIFFFNPGVRWVASLIRQEREACCDDMVLAGVPDRNSYFEALVAFKQWVVDGQAYALHLGGDKSDLLWRIRRMLDRENKKLQVMEKAILSFGLMALVSFSLISMKERDGAIPAKKVMVAAAQTATSNPILARIAPLIQTTSPQIKIDTVPTPREHGAGSNTITLRSLTGHGENHDGQKKYDGAAIDEDGNRYDIKLFNDEVTEFKVNGQLIAKPDYGQYTAVITEIVAEASSRPIPPVPPVSPVPPVEATRPMAPIAPIGPLGSDIAPEAPIAPTAPVAPVAPVGPDGNAAYEESIRRYEQGFSRYMEGVRRYEEAITHPFTSGTRAHHGQSAHLHQKP
jgi:bla regulator protein blaR1